ncbi:gliding motility protein GldN [Flavisolibacter tropicus]|uniref:type IX secretion system ring protein PorN/GldN n=1 Tax=Flavisolibacter tropicus TaxID=1492898 RepID=UPI00131444D3|nr:gliding motility protein GldN [Flavisolibacter tropicus]
MKSNILKFCLVCLAVSSLAVNADAQRAPRRRTGGGNPPAGNTGGQTQTESEQNNVNRQPSGYNPYGNIPIRVDNSSGGYNDSSFKKSLRPDAAFDKSFINERTPLPYEHLRWDDALYSEKVWRELDLREKMNQPFRFKAEDDNGDQRFISILLRAVKSGQVTAFSPEDDRFTTPLTAAEVGQLTAGGSADTSPVRDPNDPNKIIEYVVTQSSFDPESVTKLRIKEEWVFDREASRMFVRILGIAPLKTSYLPNGQERGNTVMFWVYYPDLRPTLAKYEVYNPKNMGMGRMTWEELFESRMFSSYITKSTLDNPFNQTIKVRLKDPILSLLEGDNIKDRIFNYEQDLWSY